MVTETQKLGLPKPDSEALELSKELTTLIVNEIAAKGPITFARYMELALYAPGLGYYSAGAQKFGEEGDFVTAPEISPLFAQCLARQCQQVLNLVQEGCMLELGAGSGRMAADLLIALEKLDALPSRYTILEVSADLKQRQRATIQESCPHFLDRITWLEKLPDQPFEGLIIGNEVLDAMPVHRFYWDSEIAKEYYVAAKTGEFFWQLGECSSSRLSDKVLSLGQQLLKNVRAYSSEINLLLAPWLASLSDCLEKGALLFIDYGFPRQEYYHPERDQGTLMCHYRHRAHGDPFFLPGLQDITAHVDFTEVAEAAKACGLEIAGFANQANFLLDCGLAELINTAIDSSDTRQQLLVSQQVKKLTLPHEMGELFKVVALTRGIIEPLLGF